MNATTATIETTLLPATMVAVPTSPFSLKSIRTMQGRNGEAFSANIFRGTKKVGDVTNDGNGGCNILSLINSPESGFHSTREIRAEFDQVVRDFGALTGETFEVEDAYIEALLTEVEVARALARNAKRKTPVLVDGTWPDDERLGGKRYEFSTFSVPLTDAVEASLRTRYPACSYWKDGAWISAS